MSSPDGRLTAVGFVGAVHAVDLPVAEPLPQHAALLLAQELVGFARDRRAVQFVRAVRAVVSAVALELQRNAQAVPALELR